MKAAFAQLNVIDHDGDVTLPGAFKAGQAVRVSAYNHGSWKGALPVGRGTIKEDGDFAIADMQFFLKTSHGRDTFETVDGMKELQQWSYGFDTIDQERGLHGDKAANFLKSLDVHEVSPVLLGAGLNTSTLEVKSVKDMSDDDILELTEVIVKSWKDTGIVPESAATLVRELDAAKAEHDATQEMLRTIATIRGFTTTKEQ